MELTSQREHATSVLLEATIEHIDRGIIAISIHCKSSSHILSWLLLLLLWRHAHIIVENEGAEFVARLYALLELLRLNCGWQVDLASGQTTQHYARYAEVNGASDMRLAVLLRAAAVEYDQLFGWVAAGSQLRLEPLFAAAFVLRFRHLEKLSQMHSHTLNKAFLVCCCFFFLYLFRFRFFFDNFFTNFTTTKSLHHLLLLVHLPGAHFLYFCCFCFPFCVVLLALTKKNRHTHSHTRTQNHIRAHASNQRNTIFTMKSFSSYVLYTIFPNALLLFFLKAFNNTTIAICFVLFFSCLIFSLHFVYFLLCFCIALQFFFILLLCFVVGPHSHAHKPAKSLPCMYYCSCMCMSKLSVEQMK